jgi:hypothetical protein
MTTRLFLANEYNSSMPWGGFHITLIGQRNRMPLHNARNTSFYNQNRRWTFSSSPVAKLVKWKGVWTIVFNSNTLDNLANELQSLGFSSVKGPSSGTAWHISLYGANRSRAIELFNYFVFSSNRPYWYLTLCTEHPNRQFTWQRL